jgi:hypothetical protein
MTDKQQIIQAFRKHCSNNSKENYKFYKDGKKFVTKDNENDVLGTLAKGASVFYAAIHNRRKLLAISALKGIKDYQNSMLDLMMFDSDGDEFTIHHTDTGKCVKGQSEAIRQAGKVFKESLDEMKEILTIAMRIDNDVGYWK